MHVLGKTLPFRPLFLGDRLLSRCRDQSPVPQRPRARRIRHREHLRHPSAGAAAPAGPRNHLREELKNRAAGAVRFSIRRNWISR